MCAARRATFKPVYGVHPAVAMVQNAMAGLKEKTGRSLDEWIRFIKREGPPTDDQRREWLKRAHGIGTNYAGWLVERTAGRGTEDGDPKAYLKAAAGYVEALYEGPRAALRPIHDELMRAAYALGSDVKACPCKTMVPLYRNHVFAQIKPTTRTRIDFGLALKAAVVQGKKIPKRLIETGGLQKNDRITHRIGISALDEIDDEARRWMKIAYDLDV